MAEARRRHDWSIASSVMALIASVHRDPKKRRAFKPSDFDPFAPPSPPTQSGARGSAGGVVPADVRVLKDVFIRRTEETDTGQGSSHEG